MPRRYRKESDSILPKLLFFGGIIVGGYILFKTIISPWLASTTAISYGTTTMPSTVSPQQYQQPAQSVRTVGEPVIK